MENIIKKKSLIKVILNIILLLIPIGFIIYFLTSENGMINLIESAATFSWQWIIFGVICHLSNIAADAFALYTLTKNYSKNYTYRQSLKCTAIGQFFSVVTPAAAGSQPMQLYCLKRQNVDTGVASSIIIQKFLVYQSTITLYSLVAVICNFDIFNNGNSELMITLAALGFFSHAFVISLMYFLSFNQKVTSKLMKAIYTFLSKIKIIKNPEEKLKDLEVKLKNFYDANVYLYKNKKSLFKVAGATVVQLTLSFVVSYTIYRAFNFNSVNAFDMITGQAFITMVSSFMPLPAGAGAAEGSFYVFFEAFFTPNTIKSAILIWRIISYLLTIVVCAPFIRIPNATTDKTGKENLK